MSESKQPWLVPGVPWKSESAFWVWVRGVLRKGWSKHPVKLEYIKQHRKRIANPKWGQPRSKSPEVWGMTCACCHKDTVQAEVEIDHIGEQGTFTCLADIKAYAAHLFLVDFTSLRAVCKPCHKIISYSQRMGTSFEDALREKKVIDFLKKGKQEVLDYCETRGYTPDMLTNDAKRRAALTEIFAKEQS